MKQILSISQQMGPMLQAARKSAGLSQAELARRLGISQSRLSAMELCPGSISLDQLLKLLSALNFELLVQTKEGSKVDSSASEW
ncbi:helix-turn-helix domain-containing protein [Rugamonas rubra]|uniref:helix-turn-helix domain-containing protein n=1 Tax=Rugamonas rubra TaxID=758825 RepID=UPI000B8A5AEB|nr:helix-turn-helix transcriptional regulator [Rugamonas rubra]